MSTAQSLDELRAKILAKKKPLPVIVPAVEPAPAPEAKPAPAVVVTPEPKPAPEHKPDTKPSHETREAWLERAAEFLADQFKAQGFSVPDFAVSVGFGPGKRFTDKLVGHVVQASKTADGRAQVFVSPLAGESMAALQILADCMLELVALKNGKTRANLAKLCGFEQNDKPNGTEYKPNPDLRGALAAKIETTWSAYPHAAVKASAHVPRDSAMQKAYCSVEGPQGYKLRIAASWLKSHGAPLCPCHSQTMLIEA